MGFFYDNQLNIELIIFFQYKPQAFAHLRLLDNNLLNACLKAFYKVT